MCACTCVILIYTHIQLPFEILDIQLYILCMQIVERPRLTQALVLKTDCMEMLRSQNLQSPKTILNYKQI
jgi:hypothetical protein